MEIYQENSLSSSEITLILLESLRARELHDFLRKICFGERN